MIMKITEITDMAGEAVAVLLKHSGLVATPDRITRAGLTRWNPLEFYDDCLPMLWALRARGWTFEWLWEGNEHGGNGAVHGRHPAVSVRPWSAIAWTEMDGAPAAERLALCKLVLKCLILMEEEEYGRATGRTDARAANDL